MLRYDKEGIVSDFFELAGKSIQAGENTEEKISFIRSNHPEALELYKKPIDELKKYL